MAAPATPSSGGVFISYRRQETAPYARLLREELSKHLGVQQVFMDVDSIEIGVDFAEAIERALDTCHVLLALIGSQWLTIADVDGRRRLDHPDDIVRLEIEAALARNIRVIPVLVDNTPMPPRQQLPESLAPLARRNALELTHGRYEYDIARLVEAVAKVMGRPGASMPAQAAEDAGSADTVTRSDRQSLAELRRFNDPNNPDAHVIRGGLAMMTGRLDEALRQTSRALKLHPDHIGALCYRGETYLHMRRYEQALRDLNRALKLDPNHTGALRSRGNTYMMLRRYDEALRDLNRALKLDPDNTETLRVRGNTYMMEERFDEALRDLNRALELDPDDVPALGVRGNTYIMMERFDEALRDIKRALALDPDNAHALQQRDNLPWRYRLMD